MPGIFDMRKIWQNMREIDLRPIREEAEQITKIVIVGDENSGKHALVKALREEPRRVLPATDPSRSMPEPIHTQLDNIAAVEEADLVLLVIGELKEGYFRERELVQRWTGAGKKVFVFNNTSTSPGTGKHFDASGWIDAQVISGSTSDRDLLESVFVPAVLRQMPERALSLARHYPIFRVRVARDLIADTSMANASYALSTGIAEIIPLLDVPFNVADVIILTKAQALMAYRLGLAFGLSTRWQDHLTAFGSTVGSGFIWRQVARGLVGLIPVWGIIPKVAVSYAGTYALGHGILQWYLTGRQVTPEMMRGFYREALNQGKTIARTLRERSPRTRGAARLRASSPVACPNCGRTNPSNFSFCGNCGIQLKVKS